MSRRPRLTAAQRRDQLLDVAGDKFAEHGFHALSMEAKASAVIIGALPFIVATLVYLTSPEYMMILFTDPRGHLIMGASGVWMSIGILVMRNMINFEI